MKKLSIAFIWHFHQPNYQQNYTSEFLLPWVRLHASKDYLDMLKRMDKFSNLKLNFNFSPILLNSLQKYANGAQDIHQILLLKDEKDLDEKDKTFILNNYFDLNYKNMVLKRPYFTDLYNKRANARDLNTNIFSLQEYSDIMANYTLCWIDDMFIADYKELGELLNKQEGYNLSDRKKIYEIQLDIIKRILSEYKKYQEENKIEVSISPYYHPILPLLLDFKHKEIKNFENLPSDFSYPNDAKEQIERAITKYVEIFDRKPKGMWLSEQCVCSKTAELLSKSGFKWSVLDEGILSKSLKKEFIRDFEGNLENPYNLNINYKTKNKNPLNLLFADSFFANLLNFGYGNYDYKIAANDMYEKIKTIQSKLQNSPRENHILTIALDGENCWETYLNDGSEFLDTLYGLICSDDTLQTVTVSDFIDNNPPEILDNLKPGSWINRNFDLWIGEGTKNIAWLYLSQAHKDWEKYKNSVFTDDKSREEKLKIKDKIRLAYQELLIAQGSDWYWWYGEPNESKNDDVFDYLFRRHLMNVYEILGLNVPECLLSPLVTTATRPLRSPSGHITPSLACDVQDKNNEWEHAGLIFVPDSPTSNVTRLIKNIYFGCDEENVYFRLELNKNSIKMSIDNLENQIAIYFAVNNAQNYSPIRFVSKNENIIYPIIKNNFSHEIRFVIDSKKISKMFFNKATQWGLWSQVVSKGSKIVYKDVVELKIPFKDLGVEFGDLSFFIIDATNELINEVYPQDVLISLGV
ncbi:MAG: hypothetical protein IJ877_03300 [Candidatus Gastranaerophilales bacterium]|nr:hypothetical protein [Candidatus Gastranaerophilales bacterium]